MAPDLPLSRRNRDQRRDRPQRPKRRPDLTTYRVAVGKRHKIGPGAIVGAIATRVGCTAATSVRSVSGQTSR